MTHGTSRGTSARARIALAGLALLALCLGVGVQSARADQGGLGTRIVGGTVVPDDRYPFMAALFIDFDDSGNYQAACGGSLVGSRWVLTAAHCIVDGATGQIASANRYAVVLGDRNLGDGVVLLPARRVYVHPSYDPFSGSEADIALIELDEAVAAAGDRIALPSAASAVPLAGETSVVAGWGLLSEGGVPSGDLREVALPIVSHAQCIPFYRGALIEDAMVCAGGAVAGGRDSCQGDSGGPLFVLRGDVYVQAGVVSFGEGCARPGIPGVYTRVTGYVDWVASLVDDLAVVASDTDVQDAGVPAGDLQIPVLVPGLPPEQRVGALLRGEADLYEVSGNDAVQIETTSGDADLFLFSGVQFREEDIVCESVEVTALDACAIPATGVRMFAAVFGYVDSRYVIDVTAGGGGANPTVGTGTVGTGTVGTGTGTGVATGVPGGNGVPAEDDPIAVAGSSGGGSGGGGASGALLLGLLGVVAALRRAVRRRATAGR